ncbi:hypothetical protein ACFL0O_12275 [Thermodesulfobacteriota bacterium]
MFVDNFHFQARKYRLNVEIIIVEWNPPSKKPSLSEVIKKDRFSDTITTRIITVPPEIHNTFHNSDKILLFQMIAKNVGIRRAKGHFIFIIK